MQFIHESVDFVARLWPGVFPRGAGGLLGQEGRVAVDALNVADGHGNSVLFELSAIKKANCLPV